MFSNVAGTSQVQHHLAVDNYGGIDHDKSLWNHISGAHTWGFVYQWSFLARRWIGTVMFRRDIYMFISIHALGVYIQ